MRRNSVLFFLLFLVAFNCSYSDILPSGVEWVVRNDGRSDIVYNGGVPDDLAGYTLNGIRHDSLQYRYNHARRGVLVEVGKVYWSSTEEFQYGHLTDDTSPNFPDDQLYIMFIPGADEGFDSFQHPENCFWQGYYIPWSNFAGSIDKPNNSITLTHMYYSGSWHVLPMGGYYLFRYLHLPTELKSWSGDVIGPETEKLVIIVHGWNSSGQTYQQDTNFVNLANSIQAKIGGPGSDWKLIAYDWKSDADTGSAYDSTTMSLENDMQTQSSKRTTESTAMQLWPIENATEAAETAHMHGQNLGQLILEKCPRIKQVHIIAHSAGTWCARTAIKHLIDHTGDDFRAQMTLLDPYMPFEGEAESLLGKQIIEQMSVSENVCKIAILENYYSEDSFVWGTNEQYAWGDYGFNALLSRSVSGTVYDGHDGPVNYYIDSVNNATAYDSDWNYYSVLVDHPYIGWDPTLFGWKLSMPWLDMILPERCNIDGQDGIDLSDFSLLSMQWDTSDCNQNNGWCQNADINMSGTVNFNDLYVFINRWLDE